MLPFIAPASFIVFLVSSLLSLLPLQHTQSIARFGLTISSSAIFADRISLHLLPASPSNFINWPYDLDANCYPIEETYPQSNPDVCLATYHLQEPVCFINASSHKRHEHPHTSSLSADAKTRRSRLHHQRWSHLLFVCGASLLASVCIVLLLVSCSHSHLFKRTTKAFRSVMRTRSSITLLFPQPYMVQAVPFIPASFCDIGVVDDVKEPLPHFTILKPITDSFESDTGLDLARFEDVIAFACGRLCEDEVTTPAQRVELFACLPLFGVNSSELSKYVTVSAPTVRAAFSLLPDRHSEITAERPSLCGNEQALMSYLPYTRLPANTRIEAIGSLPPSSNLSHLPFSRLFTLIPAHIQGSKPANASLSQLPFTRQTSSVDIDVVGAKPESSDRSQLPYTRTAVLLGKELISSKPFASSLSQLPFTRTTLPALIGSKPFSASLSHLPFTRIVNANLLGSKPPVASLAHLPFTRTRTASLVGDKPSSASLSHLPYTRATPPTLIGSKPSSASLSHLPLTRTRASIPTCAKPSSASLSHLPFTRTKAATLTGSKPSSASLRQLPFTRVTTVDLLGDIPSAASLSHLPFTRVTFVSLLGSNPSSSHLSMLPFTRISSLIEGCLVSSRPSSSARAQLPYSRQKSSAALDILGSKPTSTSLAALPFSRLSSRIGLDIVGSKISAPLAMLPGSKISDIHTLLSTRRTGSWVHGPELPFVIPGSYSPLSLYLRDSETRLLRCALPLAAFDHPGTTSRLESLQLHHALNVSVSASSTFLSSNFNLPFHFGFAVQLCLYRYEKEDDEYGRKQGYYETGYVVLAARGSNLSTSLDGLYTTIQELPQRVKADTTNRSMDSRAALMCLRFGVPEETHKLTWAYHAVSNWPKRFKPKEYEIGWIWSVPAEERILTLFKKWRLSPPFQLPSHRDRLVPGKPPPPRKFGKPLFIPPTTPSGQSGIPVAAIVPELPATPCACPTSVLVILNPKMPDASPQKIAEPSTPKSVPDSEAGDVPSLYVQRAFSVRCMPTPYLPFSPRTPETDRRLQLTAFSRCSAAISLLVEQNPTEEMPGKRQDK